VKKKTGAFLIGSLVWLSAMALSAEAGQFRLGHKFGKAFQSQSDYSQLIEEENGYGGAEVEVSPSQAASIAKQSWPGSKVLRVQLLPSGVYAVTLKQGGEVSRVLVDASSGAIV
jgi:uncharacterized membrane protein YkoI